MTRPLHILCVHPNGELYGSDRVFVQVVRAFRARWPDARITILLPVEGALSTLLRETESDVRVEPMVVLRRASLLRTLATLIGLFPAILRARARMREHDIVYISTVVVLDYLLATRGAAGATLIHVHELPTGRTRLLIRQILGWSRGRLLYISRAVRDAFPELAARPHDVVWNGTRNFPMIQHVEGEALNILLIGRFNAWKGQRLLLQAIALLTPAERDRVRVRLVGSAFAGQEHLAEAITADIKRLNLQGQVEIWPFDPVPDAQYGWADIVAVPSLKPEPFGLVAIEAMSAGRAVIAADHGGLAEIVVDGETGRLVPPNDAEALARAIVAYADDRAAARRHGMQGRARFESYFAEEAFMKRIADIAAKLEDA